MDWSQVLTIIFGTVGFMGIFVLLINRQIDMLSKRIDSVENRIGDLKEDVREIRQELKEIRNEVKELKGLLSRVLEAETKKVS